VRQTFVAELVGDGDLSNAIALNSTSFNAARMIGPAIAGIVIASIGTGWAFLINAASFMAVLGSLSLLRTSELRPNARAQCAKGGMTEGFHYVWARADLRAIMIMLFLIGTFGLNFPIFISTMAVTVFHTDARGFGLLSSTMAIGTISGALLAAGRAQPRFVSLLLGAATFGRAARWPRWHRLLAVRRQLGRDRRRRPDGHQHLEQPDATLDRTEDAGTRDGVAPRRRA
jgi:MFS family permease